MNALIYVCMTVFFVLGLALLGREGLLKNKVHCAFAVLFMLGALLLRYFLLPFESDDYLTFLAPWTEFFRTNGGFKALGQSVGNYNLPYLYFLALFSYSDIKALYLIKLLSVFFDIMLAWSVMKLSSLFIDGKLRLIVCFFAVLFFPTVVINGAYWAQCDSIYSFFAVLSIYLALKDRPAGSMAAIAASFAFKLQAVFIMPVFFVFLVTGKIKFKHLFIFPAAYLVFIAPALIAGRPFIETLTLYVSQAGTVGDAMNYNAPSLTSMFAWGDNTAAASKALIIAAFCFVFLLFAIAIVRRRKISSKALLGFAVLFAVAVPYLLPHMHDRYFFLATALLIALAFTDMRFSFAPVLAELASLHCYYAYFNRFYLVQPRIGGELMLVVLLAVAVFLAVNLKNFKNYENNT